MFVHVVYFWMKDGLKDDERARFVERIGALLTVDTVQQGYTGVAAPTRRDVVDSSYSYSLILVFKDKDGHDRYQVHPTHKRFVEECASFWTRVRVYDSVPIAH
jgi:hypothetical protein